MIHLEHEGSASGEHNMSRDLELLDAVRNGQLQLAFRTYTWQPWAVSLGKHQPLDAIDLTEAKNRGIDVVHRPTGGRAVLHANEITYSISVRGQAQRIYAAVHEALYNALMPFAAGSLSFVGKPTDLRQHYAASTPMGQVCFTSSARTEILAGGKKLVGSAQRLIDGVVLQHGSILLEAGHEQIAELIQAPESQRQLLRSHLMETSTTLAEVAASGTYTVDDVVNSVLTSVHSAIPIIIG